MHRIIGRYVVEVYDHEGMSYAYLSRDGKVIAYDEVEDARIVKAAFVNAARLLNAAEKRGLATKA